MLAVIIVEYCRWWRKIFNHKHGEEKLRCALSRCSTGQVNWWFVLRRGRQSRGPRSTYLLLRLLLKNVRRIRLVNRAAHEPPAIRVVWPGYLTNTALPRAERQS